MLGLEYECHPSAVTCLAFISIFCASHILSMHHLSEQAPLYMLTTIKLSNLLLLARPLELRYTLAYRIPY